MVFTRAQTARISEEEEFTPIQNLPSTPDIPSDETMEPEVRESSIPDDPGPGDLAQALRTLSDTLRDIQSAQAASASSSSDKAVKIRDPEVFDGTDPQLLESFLSQCDLVYLTRPKQFTDDRKRIFYVISFLKGAAFDWFDPRVGSAQNSLVYNDWNTFETELRTNFGPVDAEGDNAAKLERLTMPVNQHIVTYMVEFNRLSVRGSWNDFALMRLFKKGLPPRITGQMVYRDKPKDIKEMKALAQKIDQQYWEHRAEQDFAREKEKKTEPKKTENRSEDKSGTQKSGTQATATNKSATASSGNKTKTSTPQSSGSTDKGKSPEPPKLGKDGKITDEERQRRLASNLCLYCGKTGHMRKDCNKARDATKARAAKTEETSASTDAKK